MLSSLSDEFSFKFNYIDAVLPVLAEQNRFTYNILLQDMTAREHLSRTLSQAQTPAHNGYLLLEKIRSQHNQSANTKQGDNLGLVVQQLQSQVEQIIAQQKLQNGKQEFEATATTIGALPKQKSDRLLPQPRSATETQLSSPKQKK